MSVKPIIVWNEGRPIRVKSTEELLLEQRLVVEEIARIESDFSVKTSGEMAQQRFTLNSPPAP